MEEMFEPRKKEKLDKTFFKGFIFIFVLGVFLVVGTSYSLEFFKANKNGASIRFTTSAISINVTGDNTINTTLSKYIDSEGLLNGLTKELTITNNNANHGEAILKIERTSGIELNNIKYALIVNNVVQTINNVPSNGIIFDNVIMGNETLNVKVRLWIDNSYTGSETSFNGTITNEIKRTYNLTSDVLSNVIDFNNITSATNNYVSFNNEVYRIVKIEDGRLVICKNSDFDSTAASRVNSNKFNTSLTYSDNSIISSHSTDNKNLYLVKTVNIKSGKGTSTDPFILENNRDYLNDKKVSNYITYKDDSNTTLFTQPVYYGQDNYIYYQVNDPNFQGWDDGTNDYSLGDTINTVNDIILLKKAKLSVLLNLSENSGNIVYGENKEITISTNSDGALSCNSSDSTKAICSITNNILTINGVGVGEVIITVSQEETLSYNNASKTYTLMVTKAAGYVNLNATSGSYTYLEDSGISFTITGSHGGELSVDKCTLNETTVTCSGTELNAGTYTITVTSAATDNYNEATTTYELTVNKFEISPTANVMDIREGQSERITVKVSSKFIGTALVQVNDTTYSADIIRGGATIIIEGLTRGTYNALVTVVPSDLASNYIINSNQYQFTVRIR